MNRRFDAIIIGADQAGPPSAGRLTSAGMSVALIERHLFGGTCVNTGCIPTGESRRYRPFAGRAEPTGPVRSAVIRRHSADRPDRQPMVARVDHGMIRSESRSR